MVAFLHFYLPSLRCACGGRERQKGTAGRIKSENDATRTQPLGLNKKYQKLIIFYKQIDLNIARLDFDLTN
jgi:hypothetical protein